MTRVFMVGIEKKKAIYANLCVQVNLEKFHLLLTAFMSAVILVILIFN